MNNAIKILIWTCLIVILNFLGRYLYAELYMGGSDNWMARFYIKLVGIIGTLISLTLFYISNYVINKKRKNINLFSFTTIRFFILIFAVIITFIGDKIYSVLLWAI